jgi:hypothetical protein
MDRNSWEEFNAIVENNQATKESFLKTLLNNVYLEGNINKTQNGYMGQGTLGVNNIPVGRGNLSANVNGYAYKDGPYKGKAIDSAELQYQLGNFLGKLGFETNEYNQRKPTIGLEWSKQF